VTSHSRTPMINLKDNALSFTFPEIAQEVRAHFERQLRGSAAEELTPHPPKTMIPP